MCVGTKVYLPYILMGSLTAACHGLPLGAVKLTPTSCTWDLVTQTSFVLVEELKGYAMASAVRMVINRAQNSPLTK